MKRAGRFEIDLAAGSGAMGTIYRAVDTTTGRHVALKLLRGIGKTDAERFTREARSLGALTHPAIVGYVDHGATADGDAYLAMEWLEGEDLRARLARAGLTIHETLVLGQRIAGALAELHRHRLVHRDVKPANIFLAGGRVEGCKLVDFGLARPEDASVELTRTGAIIGTPQYMSPEQARGDRVVDARSDVFSLGCVLFRCLTGRAPFEGTSVMAVLTRVLLDDSPRASDLNPAVPEALDALVARMLAKKAADRHASGAELLAELDDVAARTADDAAMESVASVRAPVGLSAGEHRFAAMVLIGAAPVTPAAPTSDRSIDAPVSGEPPAPTGDRSVVSGEPPPAPAAALASVVEQHRGHLDTLLDGTRVVTILESAIAVDQATDAARCALALRDALPHVPIGLVMGRAGSGSRSKLADTIDRVVQQLERSARALAEPDAPASIAIDESIASLLGPRFIVTRDDAGASLAGESEAETRARTVLGKVTALVGREWEMSTLVALFRECESEAVARPVLITGPAGMGKSRLAGEIVPAIERVSPGVEVWRGRGLSLRAGSPLALLGSLLRSACGVRVAAPLEERRAAVLARVRRHVPAAHAQRVAEMIGELAGAPFADEHSPALRAARADGRLMGEQTLRAFKELLAAERAARPLLVLLEDLHWGDLASVRYLDEALRDLAAEPWMVLAFARPEVHERFPGLWSDRDVQEVRLKPLARRAAERLVRDVLGAQVGAADVARIVARAEGNAYHLEELIRAFAERRDDEPPDGALPPTVLAMAQARLDALDPDLRRMLRAASVFGEVFWLDGVTALLGGDTPASWGRQIEAQELVVRRPESRFAGQQELAFRHPLLREGAYAMLPDADRALGHRLAGEWLERQGETDPLVLASHFSLGGEPGRASEYYMHAAERAEQALDLNGAIAHAEKALASAPSDGAKLRSRSLLGILHTWRYDWHAALPHALAVTEQAAPGTIAWIRSTSIQQNAGILLENAGMTAAATEALLATDPVPEAVWAMAEALAFTVFGMMLWVRFQPAAHVVSRLDAVVAPRAAEQPIARGHRELAHVYQEMWANGNGWAALAHARAACAAFDEAGNTRDRLYSTVFAGAALRQLGAFDEAERELRGIPDGDSLSFVTMLRDDYLEWTWLDQGRYDEVRTQASRRLARAETSAFHDPNVFQFLRWVLAEAQRRAGDPAAAEPPLAALAPEVMHPHVRPGVLASLAAARLALGRPNEALPPAREAVEMLDAHGGHVRHASFARLVHAEALLASGDLAAAKTALASARDCLLAWSAHIPDPSARRRYLEAHPEHARTLALAEEHGV